MISLSPTSSLPLNGNGGGPSFENPVFELTEADENDPVVVLAWKNLCYQVKEWNVSVIPPRRQPKVILRHLNGSFRRNTLNGILGPSGAGKTSLIKCLNGNVPRSRLTDDTEIFLHRSIIDDGRVPCAAFVPQAGQGANLSHFTVGETLHYAFLFKNRYQDRAAAQQHITAIMEELMLDTQVLRRRFDLCSGGEQRRVAIAQELMALDRRPPFLFVDEPTTGLDSESALLVMKCLRRLSSQQNSITIIVSIHAPNTEILNLFDQLYVMGKGGWCIFSGPPTGLKCHLEQVLNLELHPDRPPIEEYLKIASDGSRVERIQRLATETLTQEAQSWLANPKAHDLYRLPDGIPDHRKRFTIGDLIVQTDRLFRQAFIANFQTFLAMNAFIAFVCLTLRLACDSDMVRATGCYPNDMNQRINVTCEQELENDSMIGTYIFYRAMMLIVHVYYIFGTSSLPLMELLPVFRNEHRNGWYSLGAFFWPSQLVATAEMTIHICTCMLVDYFSTIPPDIGFEWIRLGHFLLFGWLIAAFVQAIGQLLAVVFARNVQIMTIVGGLVLSNVNMLNGLSVAFEIMNKPLMVTSSKMFSIRNLVDGLLYSFYSLDRCQPETDFSFVLKRYHIDPENIYTNILIPVMNMIGIRLTTLAIMYIRFRSRPNRSKSINTSVANDSQMKQSSTLSNASNAFQIDYDDDCDSRPREESSFNNNNNAKDGDRMEKQCQLRPFCHGHRFIMAWRQLSLYSNFSIYETRPSPKSFMDDKHLILRNLSGQLRFGTITALMGTSGSGKTSLLKVLNGQRKTRLTQDTEFYLSKYAPIESCFIAQDISGHLLPGLTGKQSLIYAWRLKNAQPRENDIDAIVSQLLKELDITDTADTNVQKCSDGQRKRLALALELTGNVMPNLICVDEPTSGLDSNSAFLVVDCLRQLTRRNPDATVVASIHQPSTELLMMFDQCYVLARGGVGVFAGPPGDIEDFLNRLPETLAEEATGFPIETLIKYSCLNRENPIVQRLAEEAAAQVRHWDEAVMEDTVPMPDGVSFRRSRFSLRSVAILCQRYGTYLRRHFWREWLVFIGVYLALGCSLIYLFNRSIAEPSGCLNWEDDLEAQCLNKSDANIRVAMLVVNNIHYVSYSSAMFCMTVATQTMFTFVVELRYFFNEHRNGWYSSGAFYAQKILYEQLALIPIVLAYVWIVDIYDSITPNGYYRWQVVILAMSAMSFQAIGHLVVLITKGNFSLMVIVFATILSFNMILSNVFNPIATMNYALQMISNLSVLRFQNQATFWLVYGGQRCGVGEFQSILYQLAIPNTFDHFISSVAMLVTLNVLYHCLALFLLIWIGNPIENRKHRMERFQNHRRKILKLDT